MLSQESQNQAMSEQQTAQTTPQEQGMQQPESNEQPIDAQANGEASAKQPRKRRVRKMTEAELHAIMPRPSYWPIVLAFSIVVFLYGAIGNDYIMYGGMVLIVVAVIGWSLERR